MNRMERLSKSALSKVPQAAQKLKVAAEESLEVARTSRARVRRQRIISQTEIAAVTAPSEDPIDMPMAWRDDEDTQKVTLPNGTNG